MNSHPGDERLQDYALGALEEGSEEAIEAHLRECGACAWNVQRRVMEARRIGRAMAPPPVPERLVARILPVMGVRRRRAILPLTAAAAAIAAVVLALLLQSSRAELRVANARVLELQNPTAVAPPPPPDEPSVANVLEGLCRVEVERSVTEMTAWASLPDVRSAAMRDALLAATSVTAEIFDRAARGDVDIERLLTVDTLAGLDADLRSSLDVAEYEAVVTRLGRVSREAAAGAVEGLVRDLAAAVDLSAEQSAAVEAHLLEQAAWRRDIAFMPDFVRRQLCVHLLFGGGALRESLRRHVTEDQAGRAREFLKREVSGHERLWERLRGRNS